jgi:hypothetical protein
MRLSLRTDFDDRTVKGAAVRDLNWFGTLPRSPAGHDLPAFLAPPVTPDGFVAHLRTIRSAGHSFTYAMEATTMGTREQEPAVRARMLEHFGWLREAGVERVRLAMPYLVELARRNFPGFDIEIGPAARVQNPRQAAHLAGLGASAFVLDPAVNRTPELVGLIARETGKPVSVVADASALPGAPNEVTLYRHSICALLSRETPPPGGRAERGLLYCLATELAEKLAHPHRLLEIPFIRPEDAASFEAAGASGLVLLARPRNPGETQARIAAFGGGAFRGNLAALLGLLEPDLAEVAAVAGMADELAGLPRLEDAVRIENSALVEASKQCFAVAGHVDEPARLRWCEALGRLKARLLACDPAEEATCSSR